VLCGIGLMAACNKDGKDNTDNGKILATDVFISDCLQTKIAEDEETWNVYWDQDKLTVAHTGWIVPCDLHDVTISVELDDSVVTINECGEGGYVDCICDKHNLFTLTGLDHGTYTFVFKECGEERHRQVFTI